MLARNDVHRILVVEDDPEISATLAMLLAAAGYEVKTAFDGDSALFAAEAFNPQICLVDVNVPRMSGYELARRLREQMEHPPLFANVTPFDQRDDWDGDAEFDLDFTKPSDPFVVVEQLSDFLSANQAKTRNRVHNNRQAKARMPQFGLQ